MNCNVRLLRRPNKMGLLAMTPAFMSVLPVSGAELPHNPLHTLRRSSAPEYPCMVSGAPSQLPLYITPVMKELRS
jgi:hypothetical protein